MAARVAGDDEDRGARRIESAEPRRLALGRSIQALLAEFIEECVRLPAQLLELLHDFLERRINGRVIDRLAAPVEQRLPLMDRIGRAVQHLLQAALDDRQVPGDPHRVIAAPWPGAQERGILHPAQVRHALVAELQDSADGIQRLHRFTSHLDP
jgi:hypothetical protein